MQFITAESFYRTRRHDQQVERISSMTDEWNEIPEAFAVDSSDSGEERPASHAIRNWILAAVGIAVLILGMPLIQHAFARAASVNPAGAPFQALKVGDRFFRVVPTGDNSVTVELFDSEFRLIATNGNEAILTFSLPDGQEENLIISVPADTGCSMEGHSSGSGDCCPPSGPAPSEESCPHEEQSGGA